MWICKKCGAEITRVEKKGNIITKGKMDIRREMINPTTEEAPDILRSVDFKRYECEECGHITGQIHLAADWLDEETGEKMPYERALRLGRRREASERMRLVVNNPKFLKAVKKWKYGAGGAFYSEFKKYFEGYVNLREIKDSDLEEFIKECKEKTEDFKLKEYLEYNLSVKRYYCTDEENYFLVCDLKGKKWLRAWDTEKRSQFVYFEYIDDEVIEVLTEELVTMEELQEAFKELGWL